MTGYTAKLATSLSEIKKQVEEGNTKDALESLDRLFEVTCRLGKNEEALICSYLHTKETLENAERENNLIQGSLEYPHEIVLKKIL